ncbi:MAG: hypothetical protein QOI92_1200 [Chloroflexota bacterium]|nr:hypothetical protein [Chloroflexota bacterium]
MTRECTGARGPSAGSKRPNRSLSRLRATGEDLTEPGIDPMLVSVNFKCRTTDSRSEHRPSQGTRPTRSRVHEAPTSLDRPTRGEHHDRHPGPTPPGVATRGIDQPHAHAYLPFVRRRTIGLDPAHAPALAGHHEAVLPNQRLHQLSRAAARARRRRLPGLRVHAPPELARRRSPDRPTLRPSH